MELRVGNKYRLGRKIGSGSFGDIYLGKLYQLLALTHTEAHLDEQFLQFSELGFVTLGPLHCAYCM